MKKNVFLLLLSALTPAALLAQHVTDEQALQKAQAFINGKAGGSASGRLRAPQAQRSLAMAVKTDAYYVFNAENNGGYVIVSSDGRTDAILGYSTEGNLDPGNMSDHMKALLKCYETEINAIRSGKKAVPAKVSVHPAVAPMLSTQWRAYAPFNSQSPMLVPEGGTEAVRCDASPHAVAMAQIMYYHRWPQGYTDTLPGYGFGNNHWDDEREEIIYDNHTDDLPPTMFNWDLMKRVYNYDETGPEVDEVAKLIRYCGQACKTTYYASYYVSWGQHTPHGLYALGYDKNMRRASLEFNTIQSWDNLIYSELAAGRPVWFSSSSKYSDICDGYDGNGFFHLHTVDGWDTGYYRLPMLGHGQSVVVGIQPPTGQEQDYSLGVEGYLYFERPHTEQRYDSENDETYLERIEDPQTLYLSLTNQSLQDVELEIGLGLVDVGGNATLLEKSKADWIWDAKSGYGTGDSYDYSRLTDIGLTDGTYTLVPMFKKPSELIWHKTQKPMTVVMAGGTLHQKEPPQLVVQSITPVGCLVTGETQRFDVTIKNLGDEIVNERLYCHITKDNTPNFENTDYYNQGNVAPALSLEKGATTTVRIDGMWTDSVGSYNIFIGLYSGYDYYKDDSGQFVYYNTYQQIGSYSFGIVKPVELNCYSSSYDWDKGIININVSNRRNSEYSYTGAVAVRVYPIEDRMDPTAGQVYTSGNLNLAPGENAYLEIPCTDLDIDRLYQYEVLCQKNPASSNFGIVSSGTLDYESKGVFPVDDILYHIVDSIHRYVRAYSCYNDSLLKLVVPSTVVSPNDGQAYTVKGINNFSFRVWNLRRIIVSEGITTIRGYAPIDDCEDLTVVHLPSTLKYIESNLVVQCPNLKAIYCDATVPPFSGNASGIVSPNEQQKDIVLFVPYGCSDAYAKAWPWFADIREYDPNGLLDIADGTYYLYNVASKKFLNVQGDWGTRASVGNVGIDVDLAMRYDGTYTISTNIDNGNDNHYLRVLDDYTIYTDQPETPWILNRLADGTYTLTVDGVHYLAYDGMSASLSVSIDANLYNTHWRLYTKEQLVAELGSATYQTPVEATFFLPGANFGRNDLRNNLWQDSPVVGGRVENMCAEKFNTTFDVYQELTGMPNGIYKVYAQGFYREGADENYQIGPVIALRQNHEENLYAQFYANDASTPLMSIFDEAGKAGENGLETPWGYVPNNMDQASDCFSAGLYEHTLTVLVSDGTMRVGVKKDEAVEKDWSIFDNFRIFYHGKALPGDLNLDGKVNVADIATIINVIAQGTSESRYDVNGDGKVNIADVATIIGLIADGK